LEGIGGGNGEVALFKSWFVSQVRLLFATAVPAPLDGVDEVIPAVLVEIVADVIEDKELEFGIYEVDSVESTLLSLSL
jgi:hypothetical protein